MSAGDSCLIENHNVMVYPMNYEKLTAKKRLLDKYELLPDALTENIDGWFRVELTYTSNAIEGNKLGRRETTLVIESS